MPVKKTKPATFKHEGAEYTLMLGTAAFIQLEKALGVSVDKMGEAMKAPSMATIRDLFAAALIANHPQAAVDPAQAVTSALRGSIFGVSATPVFSWPAQQNLADQLLDSIGMNRAASLIAEAVEASPYLRSEPESEAA